MPAIATILRYLKTITQPGPTEDSDLLEAYCARQDGEAFAQLVHRYAGLVFGVCRRVLSQEADAEDAFQATFVLLARRATTIDRERPLASWLYTVAYQTSLKARGRRERRRQVERQAPTRMIAPDSLPASEWQDLQTLLDEEVVALPAPDRDLILLCDIEGKGHRRVAEELRIPAGSVSRRLEKARDRLRRRLTRRGVSLAGVALSTILAKKLWRPCLLAWRPTQSRPRWRMPPNHRPSWWRDTRTPGSAKPSGAPGLVVGVSLAGARC